MRGTTMELELEEATDNGPMPPALPKRLTPAPVTASKPESRVEAKSEEVIGDYETTRVIHSSMLQKGPVLAGLRVGVSRGAAGVVVRVLDGSAVRTGEVESLLVGLGASQALLDLFGLK